MFPPKQKPVMEAERQGAPQPAMAVGGGAGNPLTPSPGASDWSGLVQQSQDLYGGTFGKADITGGMGLPANWQMPGGVMGQKSVLDATPAPAQMSGAMPGGADTPNVQAVTGGGAATNTGNWSPVDPGGSYSPEDALAQVEQRLGSALSPEHRALAIQVAQQAGWSGSGPLTGAMLNAVFQRAASMTGGGTPAPQPGSGPPAGPGVPAPPGWTPGNPNQPQLPPGVGGGPDVWGTPVPPGAGPGYTPPNNYMTGLYQPPGPGGGGSPAPSYSPLGVPESTYGGINLPPALQGQNFTPSSQVTTPDQFTYRSGPTPTDFSYAGFRPTTMEDVRADPGYQAALDEGLGAIENAASAKGLTRNINTLQALNRSATDYAGRQFSEVDARRRAEHQAGYAQARDTAGFNVDTQRQAQATEFAQGLAAKGFNDAAIRQAQADKFGQEAATWGMNRDLQTGDYDRAVDAATLRDRSARETEADKLARNVISDDRARFGVQYEAGERRFDREQTAREREFASSDQFRRAVQGSEQEYRAARDRETDAWKRYVLEEERRRWLAELGTR